MKTAAALVFAAAAASAVNAEVFFKEDFDAGWEKRWVSSSWKGEQMGDFDVVSGKYYKEEEDKGLKTTQDSKFYGMSAEFPSFSNKDKTLFIQY